MTQLHLFSNKGFNIYSSGAFLTFVGGVAWMFVQSWITLRTYRIEKENFAKSVRIWKIH